MTKKTIEGEVKYLDTPDKPKLVFHIEEEVMDYCDMCQQLGEPQYGVKTHRNIPLQVHWVKGSHATDKNFDQKYFKLCSDCLADAHKSEEIEAIFRSDELWDPKKTDMVFFRTKQ
jgi:hypothetical protein